MAHKCQVVQVGSFVGRRHERLGCRVANPVRNQLIAVVQIP